jgi:heme A synthase
MDFLRMYSIALGALAVVLAVVAWRRRRRTVPDQERERREFLDRVGRITDGNVLDVQEMEPEGARLTQLILYQYEIAGVEYQCSQDVTRLRHWINLHSCRLGLPTSVKYDPQNPGNSLVISERWNGLRE